MSSCCRLLHPHTKPYEKMEGYWGS